MSFQQPIYTEKTECQDCRKCVRNCPVKAIKVENGSAMIVPELCIACGTCVKLCPVGAKHVRDDLGRVRQLLKMHDKVIVSLAPSFVSEFPDLPADKLIAVLKHLGFYGVSETALGAQEVSSAVAEALKTSTPRVIISSACPTVVELIHKYLPEHSSLVADMCSPVLAHCRLLKKQYGDETRIVFIGPCIAKKKEADAYPELLDIAIDFHDFRVWLESENIDPAAFPSDAGDTFIPDTAKEGAMYPIDGGMIAGIKANCAVNNADFMTFSGIDNVKEVLAEVEDLHPTRPLFLELLACEGGCINGPRTETRNATVVKRYRVIDHTDYPTTEIPRKVTIDSSLSRSLAPVMHKQHSQQEIRDALMSIGKRRAEDELNCGGCGYASCRDFAEALLDGKAETTMCVSYMRTMAQKQTNALFRTVPSGVVIVQNDMKIVECNQRFADIFGEEIRQIYDARPGLEGASLPKIVPFLTPFIRQVLETGHDLQDQYITNDGAVYRISIFTIEKSRIVGAFVQDVTEPSMQKDHVIHKAQEVIRRQISTVQKIAYLLGENAAESQITLNEIITSFSPDTLNKKDEQDD